MNRDRDTIGLTSEAQTILVEIEMRGWFLERDDIARFCMAYAIRAEVPEGTSSGTDTRWAAGNFDKTGEIRLLLGALYPNCRMPVRQIEYLVNEGLRLVGERLRSGVVDPSDLMG